MSVVWRHHLGTLVLTLVGLALLGFGLLLVFVFWLSASLTVGTPGPTLEARRALPIGVICVIAALAILGRLAGTPWLVVVAYAGVARYVTPGIQEGLSSGYDRLAGWYALSLLLSAAVPAVAITLGHRFDKRPRWRVPAALIAAAILTWSVIQLIGAEATLNRSISQADSSRHVTGSGPVTQIDPTAAHEHRSPDRSTVERPAAEVTDVYGHATR